MQRVQDQYETELINLILKFKKHKYAENSESTDSTVCLYIRLTHKQKWPTHLSSIFLNGVSASKTCMHHIKAGAGRLIAVAIGT